MTLDVVRRAAFVARRTPVSVAVLVAAVFTLCIGVAGAAPLGQIAEFGAPGSDPAQIQAGSDGNLWFSDRNGAVGRVATNGTITKFTSGLNPGSAVRSIAMGRDGNMWFSDPGTTRAIGVINPFTQVINEFSAGLNAGSMPLGIAAGPDGNVWFTDNGTIKAIGVIDPTTHAITEFSSGLRPGILLGRVAAGPDGNVWFGDKGPTPAIGMINPTTHAIVEFSAGINTGSLPGGIGTGSDGNVWFTDQGTTKAIGRIGVGAPAASVTAPSVSVSGGVSVPQVCGGDVWSTWAGQQPSHSAFSFDGYRWLLDGNAIAGASGTSYTPSAADVGHLLSCQATVTYTLFPVTVSAMSAAVLVKGAADQLDDLAAAVADVGPGKSLAAKVGAVEDDLAANDTADACATLNDLISEVNAQTGKKIGPVVAASLISQARNIEAALGC